METFAGRASFCLESRQALSPSLEVGGEMGRVETVVGWAQVRGEAAT